MRRVAFDHTRYQDAWEFGERPAERRGVARLDAIIQLVGQRSLELMDDADQVDAGARLRMRREEGSELAKVFDVAGELFANVRSLDLDDDGASVT